MKPRITVIVPTRNRADTLKGCLDTLVQCAYPNLRVIVSDNASKDNTLEVVHSFADPRIEVITTPKRCAMTDNFEFGLRYALDGESDDGYVMIIGDDDGVLSCGFKEFERMVEHHSDCEVFTWKYPGYTWPTVTDSVDPNLLSMTFRRGGPRVVSTKDVLAEFVQAKIRYTELARVYHGLVKISLLRKLKRGGRYVHSMNPDLYLGVASTIVVDFMVDLPVPLSINAASGHSTGTLNTRGGSPRCDNSQAHKYFEEENPQVHPSIGETPMSFRLIEFEALQFARDLGLWNEQVDPINEFRSMLEEGVFDSCKEEGALDAVLNRIANYFGWEEELAAARKAHVASSPSSTSQDKDENELLAFAWNRRVNRLLVDCENLGLKGVGGAAVVAGVFYKLKAFADSDLAEKSGIERFCQRDGQEKIAELEKQNRVLERRLKRFENSLAWRVSRLVRKSASVFRKQEG